MILASCPGEYIHPYGKGFIFYTDKKWVEGEIILEKGMIKISGMENVTIPLAAVISIDKRISLPVIKEGRSTLLVEYIDIRSRERVYTLFSSTGPCLREFKKKLLKEIIHGISISVKIGDSWLRGFLREDNYILKFEPSQHSFHISKLVDMSRRTMEIGFHKVSAIRLKVDKSQGNTEEIYILTPPLKRDFFWQLLNLLMEEYINREVIMKLSRQEMLVLQMLDQGWSYEQIQAKLEIPREKMEEILNKLEMMGIIKKIIIVKLTERGKNVMQFIPSQEFE